MGQRKKRKPIVTDPNGSYTGRGNHPYEKDALGFSKKMSIPDLSSKELVVKLLSKMKYIFR